MRQRLTAWIVFLGLTVTLAGCGTVAGVTGMGWMTASHNSIDYNDSSWCVPRKLKKVLNRVASRYGKVTVSSTKRWWLENWWKGAPGIPITSTAGRSIFRSVATRRPSLPS